MAGDELYGISQWLYTTLTTDVSVAALVSTRVYEDISPTNATFPFIIYSWAGGSDSLGVAAQRIFTRNTWLIKAVVQAGSYTTAAQIARAFDAALQLKSGTATGGTRIYSCSRRQPFQLATADNGIQYRHMGGMYSIVAQ